MNIILIGSRGAGKTTVGRVLAQRLGRPFIDLDEQIEGRAKRSIREIFQASGEAAFRELEATAIEEALRNSDHVISVGGGAVLLEQNRQALRQGGVCIWLAAPAAELHRRLSADPRSDTLRPPLTKLSPLEEIERLQQSRRPLYAIVAHYALDTGGRSADDLAEELVRLLQLSS